MTRLAIAINLDRCVGCHTCALSCKMQNNVPEGMLWNRVLTEDCDVVDGDAYVSARGLPALPERGVPARVPHRRHLQGRQGPRGDRL